MIFVNIYFSLYILHIRYIISYRTWAHTRTNLFGTYAHGHTGTPENGHMGKLAHWPRGTLAYGHMVHDQAHWHTDTSICTTTCIGIGIGTWTGTRAHGYKGHTRIQAHWNMGTLADQPTGTPADWPTGPRAPGLITRYTDTRAQ